MFVDRRRSFVVSMPLSARQSNRTDLFDRRDGFLDLCNSFSLSEIDRLASKRFDVQREFPSFDFRRLASAAVLLTYSPLIFLTVALLGILLVLILIGASLRRNQYEDFDVRLPVELLRPAEFAPETVNFYRLNSFFDRYPSEKINR